MISIPGRQGRCCDGPTRRELLRVGGAGMLGLSLPQFLARQALANASPSGTFGKAKSVILLYLQGGPSHLDICDPKPDAPSNIRGEFKPIKSNVDGIYLSEVMPLLAQQMDKCSLIRSVSYTPKGLFNHTAAMYQMLTGYTPDKVSPSGQLEPPSPRDFPNVGCNVTKLNPPDVPMLPFVMMPRPLQESNVIGKAGTAGFLGKAFDPYYLYQDPNEAIDTGDLKLPEGMTKERMQRRANLLKTVDANMPKLQRALDETALNEYQQKAFDLILSGRARSAFDLTEESDDMRERYGRTTFGQSALLARRLVEAGTRFVQVNWPAVANGNPTVDAFDTHAANFGPLKNLHCPKLDKALAALLADLDERGLLDETLVLAVGEFGRSPRMGVSTSGNSNAPDGRDHWPYCYTAMIAGAGVKRGNVYGESDQHGSSPKKDPVHPTDLLATIYHSIGLDPHTTVYNELNQPRPMVEGNVLHGLFG